MDRTPIGRGEDEIVLDEGGTKQSLLCQPVPPVPIQVDPPRPLSSGRALGPLYLGVGA